MTSLALPRDPRWFQMSVLSAPVVHGVLALDFEVRADTAGPAEPPPEPKP